MSICKGTEPSAARSSADARPDGSIVETDTPARLDRLPWGRFHTLVVVALGITWVLDGLEVTLAGAARYGSFAATMCLIISSNR
jgi:hypothetical protein